MSSKLVLQAFGEYCKGSSGDPSIWNGNAATYKWTLGGSKDGITNGVVRKLAGTDVSGTQIWAVAGSFKIKDDGTILRFVGAPKRIQKIIQAMTQII